MEIVTSWMQEGIEQGIERGIEQGIERERSLVLRLLIKRVGLLPSEIRDRCDQLSIDQIEALGEALLEFTSLADLETWLAQL